MRIDINHVEASIRRFYKTTKLLAAKASGTNVKDLIYYPVSQFQNDLEPVDN